MYSVANTRVRTQEPLFPPEPPRVLLPTSPLSTDSKGLTLHASLFIMNIKHYGKKKDQRHPGSSLGSVLYVI